MRNKERVVFENDMKIITRTFNTAIKNIDKGNTIKDVETPREHPINCFYHSSSGYLDYLNRL